MSSGFLTLISALLTAGICLILSPLCNGQAISWGTCPTSLPVVQNFSMDKFVGKWYEEWRVFHLPEAPFKCVWNEVDVDTPGNYNFSVYGGWYVFGRPIFTKLGGHITPNNQTDAKWDIHMASFIPHDSYWILTTDYSSYALTWNCDQVGPFKMETAWILRRDPLTPLDPGLVQDLKNYFVFNGMNDYTDKWMLVNNNNCNYTSTVS